MHEAVLVPQSKPAPRVSLGCYLGNKLKQGVGVQGADGQGYEVEQQPFVKGLLHERHHTGPGQGTQRDQCHRQDPIAPN